MSRPPLPVKIDRVKTRFSLNVWYSADLLGEYDLVSDTRMVVISKAWLAQYNEFRYDMHVLNEIPATRLLDRERRIMAFMIPDHDALLSILVDNLPDFKIPNKGGVSDEY